MMGVGQSRLDTGPEMRYTMGEPLNMSTQTHNLIALASRAPLAFGMLVAHTRSEGFSLRWRAAKRKEQVTE